MEHHLKTMHTPDEMEKFQCQDCERGFIRKGALDVHRMNIHLKLRPYKCRYGCDIAYNDMSNRAAHEKRTHGGTFTEHKKENLCVTMH